MIPPVISKALVACAGLLFCLHPRAAFAEFWITEFMAANDSVLRDDYGEASDWVEVFNAGPETASLDGYYLTDDPKRLKRWALPDLRLKPGAFFVIFASGREPTTEGIFQRLRSGHAAIHAPFKLDAEGEYLALVRPDGTVAQDFGKAYPAQRSDRSFGIARAGANRVSLNGTARGFLREPSPGQGNGAIWNGHVKPLYVDVPAGFFDAPFEVRMETSTEGAAIFYTLDGSDPACPGSFCYQEPVRIETTTILRAQALRPDWEPSRVVTRTFLFPGDIVHQSADALPPEWPRGSVNSQRMDYGMDPRIVGGQHPEEEVIESLRALPAVSLVMPLENWFDRRRGIYSNPQRKGKQWERPVSCELLFPDGSRGFQIDAGIRIRGGFSRQGRNPKHALRLIFRKEYGAGKLHYPLFGEEGATRFDHLDLRTSLNHSWAFGGSHANTLLRDLFCRDTQGAMGRPYTRSRYHHLFLNGHYWGVYMTQERSVAGYAATYFGGEPEDYDVVKTKGELVDGTWDAQRELFQMARNGGFRDDSVYFRALGLGPDGTPNPDFPKLVDQDNVIDYMILTYYCRNLDGPGNPRTDFPNNYYQIYNRKNPDGWKFFAHDMEHTLDRGGLLEFPGFFPWRERYQYLNAHWLHDQLALNPRYVRRFEERIDKHLFADGALASEAALARFERRVQEIDRAIIAHSARWGDASRSQPRTREDWLRAVDEVRRFIRQRPARLVEELTEWGLYRGTAFP